MSDCRFGVSPVNYPDPDPEESHNIHTMNLLSQVTVQYKPIEIARVHSISGQMPVQMMKMGAM